MGRIFGNHLLLLLQLLLLGLGELRDSHQSHGFSLLVSQTLQVLNWNKKQRKKRLWKNLGERRNQIPVWDGWEGPSGLSHSSFHHPRMALDNSRDGVSPFPGNLMNSSTSLGSIWRDLGSTGAEKPSGSRSRIPDPRLCLETPRAHKICFKIPFSLGIPSSGEAQPAQKSGNSLSRSSEPSPSSQGSPEQLCFQRKAQENKFRESCPWKLQFLREIPISDRGRKLLPWNSCGCWIR